MSENRRELRWTGTLPDGVTARSYADGTVTDWRTFPVPDAVSVADTRQRHQSLLAAWRAAEDTAGRRPRDPTILAPMTCACCDRSARFGDARFTDMAETGLCGDCISYMAGRADSVPGRRDPTVAEMLLLPLNALSGDARTALRLLQERSRPTHG